MGSTVKRILSALAIAWILNVAPASAALIAHAHVAGVAASDATTPPIDTTGATLIVVGLQSVVDPIGATDLTDSVGNTWVAGTLFSGSSSRHARMFYCINPTTNSSHTFSYLTSAGAFYPVVSVSAFNNTPAGAFDQETTGTETLSAGVTVQPGSLTPANANNLIVTFLSGDAYDTISINSGFTISDALGKVGGLTQGGASAYLVQSATTAKNPTWTVGSNDATIMALMMVFKENGGGGGGTSHAPCTLRLLGIGCH